MSAILSPSPFHDGERLVQQRLGVRAVEDWARHAVRPYLPEQHRAFHTSLPFLVVAARDAAGRPWVTLLAGGDGFVRSPDARSLVIDAAPVAGDALEGALQAGTDIGILGIEPATRRRNRVNGRIAQAGRGGLVFAVEQSFGNCPQHIRERRWRRVDATPGAPARGHRLTAAQRDWIASADTFFIASGHRGDGESPSFGMDASHRGGDPGFVCVAGATRLVFPDYAGNNHFNTIGNMVLDPRAGLLFVDFSRGSMLQLTGRTTIDWNSPAVTRIPGARRLVRFEIEKIVELPTALPLRWDPEGLPERALRLVEKTPESVDVTSFVFEAMDGGPLPGFAAGQHLPIAVEIPGFAEPVRRTYSFSGASGRGRYRISVKREPHGVVSRHLHDQLEPGALLSARRPSGDFVIPDGDGPLVLISAGVGVTPMVAMLYALVAEAGRRPVWFVHGARDGARHPLAREIRALAAACAAVRLHFAYSRPRPEDEAGVDYHSEGRIDGQLLASLALPPKAHYLLCGPPAFMADLQASLEQQGVPADRIHSESFGPLT